jgi:hypothetical protein
MSGISIFIKSYRNDFPFLHYCLKSIEKFVTGYSEIVIAIPEWDMALFEEAMHGVDINVIVVPVNEYGDGYLYQQFAKMIAYDLCTQDYIIFVDSDCVFTGPVDISPSENYKPEILMTDYADVGDAICWKEPTERWIGCAVNYEYMRRIPITYRSSTLRTLHESRPNLEQEIMSSGRFSEFNAMGIWAHLNEPDNYQFIDTANWEYKPHIARQFWSWGGIGSCVNEIETILNGQES